MIATIALVLLAFVYLIRSSERRSRAAGAQPFQPEGKLRWTDEESGQPS